MAAAPHLVSKFNDRQIFALICPYFPQKLYPPLSANIRAVDIPPPPQINQINAAITPCSLDLFPNLLRDANPTLHGARNPHVLYIPFAFQVAVALAAGARLLWYVYDHRSVALAAKAKGICTLRLLCAERLDFTSLATVWKEIYYQNSDNEPTLLSFDSFFHPLNAAQKKFRIVSIERSGGSLFC